MLQQACDSLHRWLLTVGLTALCFIRESHQGPYEVRLIEHLLSRSQHQMLSRPVESEDKAVEVIFGLSIQQIVSVEWHDYTMKWDPAKYGNIQSIRLPPRLVWTPDILLYNSADEDIDSKFATNVVVYHDGKMSWVPLGIYISTCPMDIRWFPFDEQLCIMKFGSWTYDGSKINLTKKWDYVDKETYSPNGEWDVMEMGAEHNVMTYKCCVEQYPDITFSIRIRRRSLYYITNLIIPCLVTSALGILANILPPDSGEKVALNMPAQRNIVVYTTGTEEYPDITFYIRIRRRPLYYLFNLVIPCVLIAFLAVLTFSLPPDAGEKVALSITILLSLSVLALIVAEMVPATSNAVPLIGVYFVGVQAMCGLSVVMAVIVLNLHHRNPNMCKMPPSVRFIICEWLAWLMRMSRPGHDVTHASIKRKLRMRQLETRTPPSLSLISNIRDIDNLIPRINDGYNVIRQSEAYQNNYNNGGSAHSSVRTTSFDEKLIGGGTANQTPPCLGLKSEVLAVLNELRFITRKMKEEGEEKEQVNEWKFAAMVVDRLCFWLFTLFLALFTGAIFLSPPTIHNP